MDKLHSTNESVDIDRKRNSACSVAAFLIVTATCVTCLVVLFIMYAHMSWQMSHLQNQLDQLSNQGAINSATTVQTDRHSNSHGLRRVKRNRATCWEDLTLCLNGGQQTSQGTARRDNTGTLQSTSTLSVQTTTQRSSRQSNDGGCNNLNGNCHGNNNNPWPNTDGESNNGNGGSSNGNGGCNCNNNNVNRNNGNGNWNNGNGNWNNGNTNGNGNGNGNNGNSNGNSNGNNGNNFNWGVSNTNNHGDNGEKSVYTRWGKRTCRGRSQVIYTGYIGGSSGGGVSSLTCLPSQLPQVNGNPIRQPVSENIISAWMAPAKFHPASDPASRLTGVIDCAVCLSQNADVLVYPGWHSCPTNWFSEYKGKLMAASQSGKSVNHICMDESPTVTSGNAIEDSVSLNYIRTRGCPDNNDACKSYRAGDEIECTVCSREQ